MTGPYLSSSRERRDSANGDKLDTPQPSPSDAHHLADFMSGPSHLAAATPAARACEGVTPNSFAICAPC